MNKQQALNKFFSSFGITAYKSTSVPSDVIFPYLTYEENINEILEGEVNCTVNLWYYTESESVPNRKADEIAIAVGLGGIRIPYDGGFVWIKKGSPYCQSLTDEENTAIKRRYINLTLTYF